MALLNPPPGGLAPAETPQFVALTFDDSVTPLMYDRTQTLIDGLENPGGCPVSLTYFISITDGLSSEELTVPDLVTRLWRRGHEIATHTYAHQGKPGAEEIERARDWLVQEAGVPRNFILGFRAPFLSYEPATFDHLNELGFLYDSSVSEQSGRTSSPSVNDYLWPHELSQGFQMQCLNAICDETRPRPGLWEVPMISMRNSDGSIAMPMDPVVQGEDAAYELLWRNLMDRYNGNRAPYGIHLHLSWIYDPNHVAALKRFIQDATALGDVFFANNLQVLGWIQNPVPLSQFEFDCRHVVEGPDSDLCAAPVGGCMFGTWNGDHCACQCFPSLCPHEATGQCSVQATWSDEMRAWVCDGDNNDGMATTGVTTTPATTSASNTPVETTEAVTDPETTTTTASPTSRSVAPPVESTTTTVTVPADPQPGRRPTDGVDGGAGEGENQAENAASLPVLRLSATIAIAIIGLLAY
ncbi:MAG: hypothetical protein MHM6MM_004739 [Cercozoa sp. M6MM]